MSKVLLLFCLTACLFVVGSNFSRENDPAGTLTLPPSPQRTGNPADGYNYMLYGDMVNHGIPLELYRQMSGANSPDDLGRTGDSKGIPYQFNVVTAPNGVKVVAPTCLTCHAEKLNGEIIIGLGNNTADHSYDHSANFRSADFGVKIRFGQQSNEWDAYFPLSRAYQAIGPYILTQARGVNPADKIFAALAAHRKAEDLSWVEAPQFDVPLDVVPTDVPAWWLLKKKNVLYYNGLGTGDFARLSSASGMLTMADTIQARKIDANMVDLIAWIRTLEPPAYPYPIDQPLAAQGQVLFEEHCSKCHGTYGAEETYPNKLVRLSKIGTDTLLAYALREYPQYTEWYNRSWYASGPHKAELRPTDGYVAPPLDGVWATAPYLHNGSVPTVEDLLNSNQRPKYWMRSFDNSDYDTEKLGWSYTREEYRFGSETYDTTLPGYSNSGHTFGDRLSPEERKAVLEYLKTL